MRACYHPPRLAVSLRLVERSNLPSKPLKSSAQNGRIVRECDESTLRTLADAVTQVPPGAASVALAAAALVALFALVRKLAPWLALALFTRVGRDKLLAHPTRAAALAHIQARPGVRTMELAVALGAHARTLDHHLRALARAGLVKPLLVGRERAWFAAGASTVATPMTPEQARLVEVVERHPGLSQRELARAAGVAPSTVSHHVRSLGDHVEARQDGRTKRLFALGPRED